MLTNIVLFSPGVNKLEWEYGSRSKKAPSFSNSTILWNWVATAGVRFENITPRLGDLLTTQIGGYQKLIVRIREWWMMNWYSLGEGVNWVATAGECFENMMPRLGGLLTEKLNLIMRIGWRWKMMMNDYELVLVRRRRELRGECWRVHWEYDVKIRRLVDYKKWRLSEVDRED